MVVAGGADPVHFGTIMIVDPWLGPTAPPAGSVLFVGAAAKLPIEKGVPALLPFFGPTLIDLAIVTCMPALSLWLPRAMGL